MRMSIIIADVILKDSNFTQWYCGVSAPFSMYLHWPHFLILNLPQLASLAANKVRLVDLFPIMFFAGLTFYHERIGTVCVLALHSKQLRLLLITQREKTNDFHVYLSS